MEELNELHKQDDCASEGLNNTSLREFIINLYPGDFEIGNDSKSNNLDENTSNKLQ